MKTKLCLAKHSVLAGHNVIEVWYSGMMIAEVTGADGPGVRIISKYQMEAVEPERPEAVSRMANIIEVRVR